MTQRSPTAYAVRPKELHLHQIQPLKAWVTLTAAQQAAVLQALVTMCQECLLPEEEVKHDSTTALAENHPNPS